MKAPESDDLLKEALEQKSLWHREQLEEEVKFISERTEKILTNALIVGGALALTYFLLTNLTGKSKSRPAKAKRPKTSEATVRESEPEAETEPQPSGVMSQIATAIASQASIFLLTLAREKLLEYLNSQSRKEDK